MFRSASLFISTSFTVAVFTIFATSNVDSIVGIPHKIYSMQRILIHIKSRYLRSTCPSAPRVCSEPGGQKPVLSLSLDLIGSLGTHFTDISETCIKIFFARKCQRLRLNVLNTREVGTLKVNFSRTEIWSSSRIKFNCRRLILSHPLTQSVQSRYSQIIVQWNREKKH